jgi:microcystin-dependent protein
MAEKDFKISKGLEVDEYVISPSGPIDGQSLVYDGSAYIPTDIVPIGTIEMWAGSPTPPDGWLLCNGGSYSWSTHTRLRDVIGISYGGSSGTSWNVPNLISSSSFITPVGTTAGGALGNSSVLFSSASTFHQHNFDSTYNSGNTSVQDHRHDTDSGSSHSHTFTGANWGHNHNTGGPSANHAHGYIRGSTSAVTGGSAHANHNVSNTNHAHKHNFPSANLIHAHSYNSHTTNAHSHNWNAANIASSAGGSNHSHSVNKQSIYFIIKY